MRAVVRRVAVGLWLTVLAAGSFGQSPTRTQTDPKQDTPQQLGPATAPTIEKATEAVKAPVGLQPMSTAAPVDPKTYQIGPEDILQIRVWREPELSSGVQVRPDGKITMPLIGELQAAGHTPEQLRDEVVNKLTEYINKPEVMVSVQAVHSRRYYITGEVNRPGAFALVVPTRVLEALTNAGGFREFANAKKITILRNGKIIKFNYNDVIKGKNMDQNILIENGDYVVVP